VQVNGKLRGEIEVAPDAEKALVEGMVMNLDSVQRDLSDKQFVKFVYVPGRVANVVAKIA